MGIFKYLHPLKLIAPPYVISKGKTFVASPFDEQISKESILYNGRGYPCLKGPSMIELEQRVFQDKSIRQRVIELLRQDSRDYKKKDLDEIYKSKAYEIVGRVFRQVLVPIFKDRLEELEAVIESEQIRKDKAEKTKNIGQLTKNTIDSCLVSSLGDPLFVGRNSLFALKPTEKSETVEMGFKARAQTFCVDNKKNLLPKYFEKIAKELVDEEKRKIQERKQLNKDLVNLGKQKNLTEGYLSIEYVRSDIDNLIYRVIVSHPKFAKKHPFRDEYYAFKKFKISVLLYVNIEKGKFSVEDKIRIKLPYEHIFLHKSKWNSSGWTEFCDLTAKKDYRDNAKLLVGKLLGGLMTVTIGFSAESIKQHYGNKIDSGEFWGCRIDPYLEEWKIPLEKALKDNYIIYEDSGVRR